MKKYIFETINKKGVVPVDNDIRWCLTVPAIWTDYSKEVMNQAAQYAGWCVIVMYPILLQMTISSSS